MIWLKHNIATDLFKKMLDKRFNKVKNKKVEVGFFDTATYPDGTYVAQVALENEIGTYKVPPRPFFTQAVQKNKKKWLRLLKKSMMTSTETDALDILGEKMRGDIVRSIIRLKEPPNAPYTIKKKKSSNPLVDTGHLNKSVDYELIEYKKGKK